jgi:hypothetical protein
LQSAKEVLVIHNFWCLKMFARCVHWSLAVKHKTKKKTMFIELLVCWPYPRLLQQLKSGSIILNQKQKGNP